MSDVVLSDVILSDVILSLSKDPERAFRPWRNAQSKGRSAKISSLIADSACMEPQREVVTLEAEGSYYREWAQDLLSREQRATGGYNEHDWQSTRDACKIVLISNN